MNASVPALPEISNATATVLSALDTLDGMLRTEPVLAVKVMAMTETFGGSAEFAPFAPIGSPVWTEAVTRKAAEEPRATFLTMEVMAVVLGSVDRSVSAEVRRRALDLLDVLQESLDRATEATERRRRERVGRTSEE
jgi:hypothetical protein